MISSLSVLMLVLVAGIVFALVRRLRSRDRRVTAPSCGACRYEVAGLETLRCPECGADLRTVGIITPAMAGGMPRGVQRALLLAVFSIVFWIVFVAVEDRVDVNFGSYVSTEVATYMTSGALPDIEVTYDSRDQPLQCTRVAIRFPRPEGPGPVFVIDPATRRFRSHDHPRLSTARVRSEDLASWLQRSGYRGGPADDDETIPAVAAELLAAIEARIAAPLAPITTRGPLLRGLALNSVRSFTPYAWYDEIAGTLGVVLWLAGGAVLWRLTRAR